LDYYLSNDIISKKGGEKVGRAIEEKMEQMNKQFEKIDVRFEMINKKFDKIDQRFEAMDERLDSMEQRLEAKIDSLRETVENNATEFRSHFRHIEAKLDEHKHLFEMIADNMKF
jgi:DNA anti-recombination protein RmuC